MVACLIVMICLSVFGAETDKCDAIIIGAAWCQPCQEYKRQLSTDLPKKRFESLIFLECTEDVQKKYNITSIPCTLFTFKGKEVSRVVGCIKTHDFLQKAYEANERIINSGSISTDAGRR